MEFLGIGPLELVLILIVALIVLGPRDIAKTAKTAGRFLNRLYHSEAWRNLIQASRTLRSLPNRLAREAALEELDETTRSIRDEAQSAVKELKEVEQQALHPPEVKEAPSTAPPAAGEPTVASQEDQHRTGT